MKKTGLLPLALAIWVFTGCKTEEQPTPSDGIGFYLLASYQTTGQSCRIDERSVATEDQPVISYSELQSYNPDTYTFEISDDSKARIRELEHSVHGLAFAVKAGRQLVYTGYFWPSYSSASCDWVTIDPVLLDQGMVVRLGYPGIIAGQAIPDRRNDPLILKILERDDKLIR